MVIFSLKAKAAPEHCSELLHFITSILKSVRLLEGCLECHCYQSVEDECSFYLVERWLNHACLKSHLNSDIYRTISGAFKVLAGGVKVELTCTDTYEDGVNHSGEREKYSF